MPDAAFARTDNPTIARALGEMRDLVLAHGGKVHPAAIMEENAGSLRVLCADPAATGQALFVIPAALLVPIGGLNWQEGTSDLRLASPPAELSPARAQMFALFLAIYNAAGKMADTEQQIPRALAGNCELAQQLAAIMPGQPDAALGSAEAFLATRRYRCKLDHPGMGDGLCLMPLIDFINHHADGARYGEDQDSLGLNVAFAGDTAECFARYRGHADPLTLALGYGFVDRETPFAMSVPVALDLGDFGRLQIHAERDLSSHAVPLPRIDFTPDGLSLSHLIGDSRKPQQAMQTLRLALTASAKRRGLDHAVVERALATLPKALFTANRDALEAFRACAANSPENAAAALLAEASACQLANLTRLFSAQA